MSKSENTSLAYIDAFTKLVDRLSIPACVALLITFTPTLTRIVLVFTGGISEEAHEWSLSIVSDKALLSYMLGFGIGAAGLMKYFLYRSVSKKLPPLIGGYLNDQLDDNTSALSTMVTEAAKSEYNNSETAKNSKLLVAELNTIFKTLKVKSAELESKIASFEKPLRDIETLLRDVDDKELTIKTFKKKVNALVEELRLAFNKSAECNLKSQADFESRKAEVDRLHSQSQQVFRNLKLQLRRVEDSVGALQSIQPKDHESEDLNSKKLPK